MRIAFIVIGNSRRSNYLNGYNIRYGNGSGSGTDTSCILVAEYLAKQGHDVVFVTDKLEPQLEEEYKKRGIVYTPGNEFYGVKYTNIDFEGIENKEFDVLISMLWFHDYAKLPIKVTKSIIYWSHMQWIYGLNEIIDFAKENNLSLRVVNISEWERKMNNDTLEVFRSNYSNTKTYTIPNPIMDEIVEEVLKKNHIKKPHKFSFHASWARGGNVAIDAVRKLNFKDTEFHAFDYLITIHPHEDNFFHQHDGVDKKTLFTHLAESEYFIYPLYTPYKNIHKDTFSCVVAEAIALGAIVITYPFGALPENFDGYCVWLDLPPNSRELSIIQKESLSPDEEGIYTYTDNIVKKIKYLEEHPEIKETIRKTGKEYILSNFSINKVGKMWDTVIQEL